MVHQKIVLGPNLDINFSGSMIDDEDNSSGPLEQVGRVKGSNGSLPSLSFFTIIFSFSNRK